MSIEELDVTDKDFSKHLVFLGSGTYAEVYTISSPGFEDKVLKVSHFETPKYKLVARQEHNILTYLNECEVKSVVQVFGYKETKHYGYLLMEKLDATASRRRSHKVPLTAYLKALKRIHKYNVLHGDIAQGNVMYRDGLPVFIDFGKANYITSDSVLDVKEAKLYEINRMEKLFS